MNERVTAARWNVTTRSRADVVVASMTDVCVNRPIDADLTALRVDLARELASPVACDVEPVHPLNAYTVAFGEHVHDAIRRRVVALYSPRSYVNRRRAAEQGHVYVFRDRRDAPASMVKIGSSRNVRRRMSEWRSALSASDDDLRLLFAYESRHVRLAEAIVHAVLFCQWQPKRVNVRTNERAVEYFDVVDWRALRQLVAATVRHVDWWLDATTAVVTRKCNGHL